MFDSPVLRFASIVFILSVLFGLMIWFGTLSPDQGTWNPPKNNDLAENYDEYIGENAEIGGNVVSTEPLVLDMIYGGGKNPKITIEGYEGEVSEGRRIVVYGEVKKDKTVEVIDMIVIPQTGVWYAYITSFVAGLWVLGRILNHWKPNTDLWGLKPRKLSWIEIRRGDSDD